MSWKEVSLNTIAKVSAGISAPKIDFSKDEGIPFVRASSLEFLVRGISIKNCELIPIKLNNYKTAKKDSIVFAKSGMSAKMGRVFQLETEAVVVSHLAIVTANTEKVLPEFLKYYFIWSPPFNLIRDDAYPSIKLTEIEKIQIPHPDLRTQKQIVDVLDKAQSLVRKREQSIQRLDELLKATFLDMFGDPVLNEKGWELTTLSNLGKWHSGGTPLRSIDKYFKGSIPWYSSGELNNVYTSESKEKISVEAIKETSAKLIEGGSLLIGMYDTAALKSSITTEKASCNQAIAFAKLDDKKCSTLFAYYAIQLGREHYLTQRRGVRQRNLNLSMVKNFELPLPKITLQREFEAKVLKIFNLKNKITTGLVESNNLFQSLLQDAFAGKLQLEEDNLALQNAKKKVKWFDEQLQQIVENSAAMQLQKKLDQISGKFSAVKRIEEIEQRLNKLNVPSLDKISELQKKLEKMQTPNLKYLKSFEVFQKLEQDGLIKKVTDNKPFKIKSFEEFVKSQKEETLKKQIQEDNDPVLRFIGEEQIGKATISNYSINVARVIYEYFGQKEFNLQTLEDVLVNNYALAVKQLDLKKDLFKIFEEFITSKLNGFFAFDDMRSQMKKQLFNPAFELLQDFVETGLKRKTIRQRFITEFKHPEKWHPSNLLDWKTGVDKYIEENGDRVYLILNLPDHEDK